MAEVYLSRVAHFSTRELIESLVACKCSKTRRAYADELLRRYSSSKASVDETIRSLQNTVRHLQGLVSSNATKGNKGSSVRRNLVELHRPLAYRSAMLSLSMWDKSRNDVSMWTHGLMEGGVYKYCIIVPEWRVVFRGAVASSTIYRGELLSLNFVCSMFHSDVMLHTILTTGSFVSTMSKNIDRWVSNGYKTLSGRDLKHADQVKLLVSRSMHKAMCYEIDIGDDMVIQRMLKMYLQSDSIDSADAREMWGLYTLPDQ